jgi:Family of unknown function (DUF6289)
MVRRLVLAASLAAAGVVLPMAPAQAIGSCGTRDSCTYLYYSDSAHTDLVGTIYVECNGTTSTWGTPRGYLVSEINPCVA